MILWILGIIFLGLGFFLIRWNLAPFGVISAIIGAGFFIWAISTYFN